MPDLCFRRDDIRITTSAGMTILRFNLRKCEHDTMKQFLFRFFFLSLCVFGLFLFPRCAKKPVEPATAPDFMLKTLDDQEMTLSALKGKVVLLDFWATWCGPCKESIPHLTQIYKSYHDKGFEVIGMSMDRGDVNTVRNFVKSIDIPYPIIITPDEVARKYAITGLPTTFLIDREGKVREKMVGFNTTIAQQMVSKVSELLSEKP